MNIRISLTDARGAIKVGDTVTTNATGSSKYDGPTLKGVVGEITKDGKIYIWQNERSGSAGDIHPKTKGFSYSWEVRIPSNENGTWIEIETKNTNFISVLSDDPFDDRLIMENTDVLSFKDTINGRPVFQIIDKEKWNTIKSKLEKLGEIEFVNFEN